MLQCHDTLEETLVVQVGGTKMFVFYKKPLGVTYVDDKPIHGYMEKHPPIRISWANYRRFAPNLIQASYTPERLKMLFPKADFPNIIFLYSDLRYLTWEQMCGLCKGFGITTARTNHERRKALRNFLKEYC